MSFTAVLCLPLHETKTTHAWCVSACVPSTSVLLCVCRFIDDPVAAFPEGVFVSGRLLAAASSSAKGDAEVASTQPKQLQQRLEMTLRCGLSDTT